MRPECLPESSSAFAEDEHGASAVNEHPGGDPYDHLTEAGEAPALTCGLLRQDTCGVHDVVCQYVEEKPHLVVGEGISPNQNRLGCEASPSGTSGFLSCARSSGVRISSGPTPRRSDTAKRNTASVAPVDVEDPAAAGMRRPALIPLHQSAGARLGDLYRKLGRAQGRCEKRGGGEVGHRERVADEITARADDVGDAVEGFRR